MGGANPFNANFAQYEVRLGDTASPAVVLSAVAQTMALYLVLPADVAPWLPAQEVALADSETGEPAEDGECVSVVVLGLHLDGFACLEPARSGALWSKDPRWPCAAGLICLCLNLAPVMNEQGLIQEDVTSTARSKSPQELDAVFAGAIQRSAFSRELMDLQWPNAEPDFEGGAGTGGEEPAEEPFFSSSDRPSVIDETLQKRLQEQLGRATSAAAKSRARGRGGGRGQGDAQTRRASPRTPKAPGGGRGGGGRGRVDGDASAQDDAAPPPFRGETSDRAYMEAQFDALMKFNREMSERVSSLEKRQREVPATVPPAVPPKVSGSRVSHWGPLDGRSPPGAGGGAGSSKDDRAALEELRRRYPAPQRAGGEQQSRQVNTSIVPRPGEGPVSAVDDIDGDDLGLDDGMEDEVNAGLLQVLDRMARTEEVLVNMQRERLEGGDLLAGGSGDSGSSIKGAAIVMRNRSRFMKDPLSSWNQLETRVKDKLNWEPGTPWATEAMLKHVPWGPHRLAKRIYFIVSKIHLALRNDDLNLTRGLTAQLLKFLVQVPLDHGSTEGAWTLFPYEDPARGIERDSDPPPLETADPFAGLCEAHEVTAALAYIRDIGALGKARQERLGRRAPTRRDDDDGDKDPGRAAKRAAARAKAKAAAAAAAKENGKVKP